MTTIYVEPTEIPGNDVSPIRNISSTTSRSTSMLSYNTTSSEIINCPIVTSTTSGLTVSGTLNVTGTTTLSTLIGTSATFSGNLTSASYNMSSDYRIKENVQELNSTFTVDNLKPVIYENKLLEKQSIGFLAHEVQEIYPYLVTGEKDGKEYQSLDYIGLIGILVKEIKEMKELNKKEISELNNKIDKMKYQLNMNTSYFPDSDSE